MSIEEIRERWQPSMKNFQSAVEWWNSKANTFASKDIPTAENSLAMRLILDNQMINSGQSALDVGCGGGHLSFALEQLGACVIGTDFSPRMIEECKKAKIARSSSANFCVYDWNSIDLQKLDWENRFDLVLANMTPAVASADTFLKLSKASRKWCLMVKPTRRKNAVLDKLTALLELETDKNALDETLVYAFALLWLDGRKPKIEYEEQRRENDWQIDDAIQEYTLRISASHTLSLAQKQKIADFLYSIRVDDVVKETTTTTVSAIYWQV